jgi:hypothetical protein
MPDIQLPKLETPPQSSVGNEPVIFSMPEKYRGLTAKVNPPLVKPVTQPTPEPPKPVVTPSVKPIVTPVLNKNRKSLSKKNFLLIVGVVVLVILGAGGIYFYLVSSATPKNTNSSQNINTTNTNNSRGNRNSNVIKPSNSNSNQSNTNFNINSASPFPQGEQPGRDTDSDGLTNSEEVLYHTDSKLPDTDNDGFLDGNEVFHGYDPSVPSPAKLSASSVVILYTAADNTSSFYYPTVWTPKPAENGQGVVLVAPTSETFSVTSQSKDPKNTLADWYSGTNPAVTTKVTTGKTKQGYSMLTTDKQMTVYVDAGSKVIIFDYQNTLKATVDFLTTFTMMVNSLTLSPL